VCEAGLVAAVPGAQAGGQGGGDSEMIDERPSTRTWLVLCAIGAALSTAALSRPTTRPDGLRWSVRIGEARCGSPALGGDGTIYVSTHVPRTDVGRRARAEEALYAIDPAGHLRWRRRVGKPSGTPCVRRDGSLLVLGAGGEIVHLSHDGEPLKGRDLSGWARGILPHDAWCPSDILAAGDAVYVLGDSFPTLQILLVALDARLQPRWHLNLGPHPMVFPVSLLDGPRNLLTVLLADGELCAVSRKGIGCLVGSVW
jgi:outer membrane protein assembly factor BamB